VGSNPPLTQAWPGNEKPARATGEKHTPAFRFSGLEVHSTSASPA